MPKKFFESKYPNISSWVNQENGIIEIGWRDNGYSSAFVRAFDIGGTFWEGEDEYELMDDALLALEGVLKKKLIQSLSLPRKPL